MEASQKNKCNVTIFLLLSHLLAGKKQEKVGEELTLEARHGPNLHGNASGEIVHVEVEVGQLGEVGDFSRYLPADGIVVQVEPGEALEARDRRRDGAREPLPLQRYVRHLPVLIAGHSLEVSSARVPFAGPWWEDPVLRIQSRLHLHQRPHLRVPPWELELHGEKKQENEPEDWN